MKFGRFCRKCLFFSLPFLFGLFCVFLGNIPISFLPYYHQALPLILGVVFYFSIFNPLFLNAILVFILGLISDSLSALPMGVSSFIYIYVFFIGNFFRPYFYPMVFSQLWLVFALVLFSADIIWSFLFFLISGVWVSSGFWFVQYLFTLLLYPVICRICGFLNKKIKEQV